MKEVLQFSQGPLSPVRAENLDDLKNLLYEREIQRFLSEDTVLPRETVAGILTQSAQLDDRCLGLWMIRLEDGSFAVVDEPNSRSHKLMKNCDFGPVGCIRGPANALILYKLQLSQDPRR
ncbi:MAG: hypothetical protein ACR2OW_01245 [Methyloligellaceae bacterium]